MLALTAAISVPWIGCDRAEDSPYGGHNSSIVDSLAIRRSRPDALTETRTRGGEVYQHYCQICHGTDGQGDGFNSGMLDPPPRNFAEQEFWAQADHDHLMTVILQGGQAAGKSKLMPKWGGTIDEKQAGDVIAYLRSIPELVKRRAEAEAEAEAEDAGDESTE